MKKDLIKVKLTGNEVEALEMGYRAAIVQMNAGEPEGHDYLLHAHAVAMQVRLKKECEKEQAKYTLNFTIPEAVAFYQLWKWAFKLTPYSANAVRKVYGDIDQKYRSAQHINVRPVAKQSLITS